MSTSMARNCISEGWRASVINISMPTLPIEIILKSWHSRRDALNTNAICVILWASSRKKESTMLQISDHLDRQITDWNGDFGVCRSGISEKINHGHSQFCWSKMDEVHCASVGVSALSSLWRSVFALLIPWFRLCVSFQWLLVRFWIEKHVFGMSVSVRIPWKMKSPIFANTERLVCSGTKGNE